MINKPPNVPNITVNSGAAQKNEQPEQQQPEASTSIPVGPPKRVPYASAGEYGDRIPPQQMVRSEAKPIAYSATPRTNVPADAKDKPTEGSSLLGSYYGGSNQESSYTKGPQERHYAAYDTDDEYEDDDEESLYLYGKRRRQKLTKLVNFWASILALLLSGSILGWSIYSMTSSTQFSSAVMFTNVLGVLFGSVSVIIEFFNCIPDYCPSKLQWKLGQHAMLHLLIAAFSIIPYVNHQKLFGTLFVLHLIPGCLFYVARLRRERKA